MDVIGDKKRNSLISNYSIISQHTNTLIKMIEENENENFEEISIDDGRDTLFSRY